MALPQSVSFDYTRIAVGSRTIAERLFLTGVSLHAVEHLAQIMTVCEAAGFFKTRPALSSNEYKKACQDCAYIFAALMQKGLLSNVQAITISEVAAVVLCIATLYADARTWKSTSNTLCAKKLLTERAWRLFVVLKHLCRGRLSVALTQSPFSNRCIAQIAQTITSLLPTSTKSSDNITSTTLICAFLLADAAAFKRLVYQVSAKDAKKFTLYVPLQPLMRALFPQAATSHATDALYTEQVIQVGMRAGIFTERVLISDPASNSGARTLATTAALKLNRSLAQRLIAVRVKDGLDETTPAAFFEVLRVLPQSGTPSTKVHQDNVGKRLFAAGIEIFFPVLDSPIETMLSEACRRIRQDIADNPAMECFYRQSLDGQTALFIPKEWLYLPEVFWLNPLIHAGVLLPSKDSNKESPPLTENADTQGFLVALTRPDTQMPQEGFLLAAIAHSLQNESDLEKALTQSLSSHPMAAAKLKRMGVNIKVSASDLSSSEDFHRLPSPQRKCA